MTGCKKYNWTVPATLIFFGVCAIFFGLAVPRPVTPPETSIMTPSWQQPVITNIVWDDSSTPKGNVTITWDSQADEVYDVYYADTFAGTYSDVADVTATGSSTAWTDDGSQTGSHPSTMDQRYYKIACQSTSDYAEYIVGMYKIVMEYYGTPGYGYTSASLPLIPYYSGTAPDVNDIIGNQGHADSVQ
ncbi:MAG: hypothetical protein NT045_02545, partial [Candidatus Aureabacteria bacterium]|nr:hypothetical protein [Candidatus Auribacterota bacterium]